MKTIIINKSAIQYPSIEIDKYLVMVYHFLELLEDEYPGFYDWYFSKVVQQLDSDRSIILKILKDEVAGVAILKKSRSENKICTFRVLEKFQGIGIGTELMTDSLNLLETNSPIITVSESRIAQFSQMLSNFKFKLNSIHNDYYFKGNKEYSYNGTLEMI